MTWDKSPSKTWWQIATGLKRSEWDPSRPIFDLIQRVQEIEEFVTDGQRPILEDNIVDAIYTVIYNTGVYFDDCVELEDKPTSIKHSCACISDKKQNRNDWLWSKRCVLRPIFPCQNALINMVTTAPHDWEQMRVKDKTIADQVILITTLTQ